MNTLVTILLLLCLFAQPLYGKVDGTTGLPLGGIGTGAIKYAASHGTFSGSFRSPTRDGDYDQQEDWQFQIFTKQADIIVTDDQMTAHQENGRVDDDAVFPLHWTNFGDWNGVSVELTAYCPYAPDSLAATCHPAALFEFSLMNSAPDTVLTAVAFQVKTPVIPSPIPDTGFSALGSALEFCLLGEIQDGQGDISYGHDPGFFATGQCDNQLSGLTNRLALRTSLAPGQSRILRFVLAWYRASDTGHYRYSQFWSGAPEVALSALTNFSSFKADAQRLVNRMRNSNLPDWLVDQTLNSLVNLVNNSVFFQDGRYCHTEGQWEPEGTMDQMWHSRQIYTMINPELAWQELEWWARTQHVQMYTGQIHHDFGTYFNYVDWDDTEHPDYRLIFEWVDLNCGFIISTYEAFITTGDQAQIAYFWPYVKNAAQRILDQVAAFGSPQYPYTFSTSKSTYDAGGDSQAYNTGLSIVAYHIMVLLAGVMREPDTAALYQDALQQAVAGFEARWLDQSYPVGHYCESAIAGPWIANYLKIQPFWPRQKISNLFMTLVDYYSPLSQGLGYYNGSYAEWQPYLVGHLAGFAAQARRTDIWQALQQDMYERNYLNRDLVFNEQLGIPPLVNTPNWVATSISGTNQYISIPVLWRNYYTLVGFHRNAHTGEIWLEPILFEALDHQLEEAPAIIPGGFATVSYETFGESFQNQRIVLQSDLPLEISTIYVWDLYGETLDLVRVNGEDSEYLREGDGLQAHLRINWDGTLGAEGLIIEVQGDPTSHIPPAPPQGLKGEALGPSQILLQWDAPSGDISGYFIETWIDDAFHVIGQASWNDTTYRETGLLPATGYVYRVRAFNDYGSSYPSEEITVTTLPGGTGDVVLALNSGGSSYISDSGIYYLNGAATGWVSGGFTYSTSAPIAGTDDDYLYQTERYGEFSYAIPLPNGFYEVVLKFAEIYQDFPGTRIFHVDIEGERVIGNLDLILRTGKNRAYDVVVPTQVTDEVLDVQFFTVLDNAKTSAMEIREGTLTGLSEGQSELIPRQHFLDQNHPNPFNQGTTIVFGLPQQGEVSLQVYSVRGQKVATLVSGILGPGEYRIVWDAADLPSGVYFLQLKAGVFRGTRKLIYRK